MRPPTPSPAVLVPVRAAASTGDRPPGHRRHGAAALALAVAALLLTVAWRPPQAPPLYDGLGFPDEPYRWVSPPAGAPATSTATVLRTELALSATDPAVGTTAEQGPQLAVQLRPTDIVAPAGATKVTVVGTPQAAPAVPPDGTLVSNLYRWTVTADRPGPVTVAPGSKAVVNLRSDAATTQPVVLEAWDGKAWHQIGTNQAGADVYAAYLTSWLPVALVKLPVGARPSVVISAASGPGSTAGASAAAAPSTPQQSSGSSPPTGLYLGAGLVLVGVAVGLLLARRRSGPDPDDDTPTPGNPTNPDHPATSEEP